MRLSISIPDRSHSTVGCVVPQGFLFISGRGPFVAEPRLSATAGAVLLCISKMSVQGDVAWKGSAKLPVAFVSSHALSFLLCRLARGGLFHPLPQWHMGLWL